MRLSQLHLVVGHGQLSLESRWFTVTVISKVCKSTQNYWSVTVSSQAVHGSLIRRFMNRQKSNFEKTSINALSWSHMEISVL